MSETYRIVIADDEAIICMDLKEILEEAGHEVVGICADGVRALELVKEEKPDLVILDVQMPKLDGLQAAKLIAHDALAPVVLLTAYGDAETVEKAKRSHVFGYVKEGVSFDRGTRKPFFGRREKFTVCSFVTVTKLSIV